MALLLGCGRGGAEHEYTPMPIVNHGANPPTGGAPPPNRLPPTPTPGDATTDAGALDATPPLDAGPLDAGPVDALVPDAAAPQPPDAARPLSACGRDSDCGLVVRLAACEICPVAWPLVDAVAHRCVAGYVRGRLLTDYTPADCVAECGVPPGGLFCEDAPTRAACVEGRCRALP